MRGEGFRTGLSEHEREKATFSNLGVMRARVEFNDDPKKIGRVKVRVPSIHGMRGLTKEFIDIEDLPWATPCFSGGVGQDFGQFIPPVPGTFVWVMFEDNDRDKPVYLGGVPSAAHTVPRIMNNLLGKDSPLRKWTTKAGVPDTPAEIFKGKETGVPERFCVYKSQKGHAIIFDDTDGEESLSIIDRVGQILKFYSPVSAEDNEGGYFRGADSAEDNKQLEKGINPSIMLKTGETVEGKIHTLWRIWQDRFHAEYVDTDSESKTTTDIKHDRFVQQTKDSILQMLEKSITLTYPGIVEYMCDDYFSISAFNKGLIRMDKDQCVFKFGDDGITIDMDHLLIKFKGSSIELDKDGVSINGKKVQMEASEGLTGSAGKDFSFESSGGSSIKSNNGKTEIKGSEVHLN